MKRVSDLEPSVRLDGVVFRVAVEDLWPNDVISLSSSGPSGRVVELVQVPCTGVSENKTPFSAYTRVTIECADGSLKTVLLSDDRLVWRFGP